LRVRGDFDAAGLTHVTTLLAHVPGATPWRMGVMGYQDSLPSEPAARIALDRQKVPDSRWGPALAGAMRARAAAAYEDALLPRLFADLRSSDREDS
jgi:hypothetical protein